MAVVAAGPTLGLRRQTMGVARGSSRLHLAVLLEIGSWRRLGSQPANHGRIKAEPGWEREPAPSLPGR